MQRKAKKKEKQTKNRWDKQKTMNRMVDLNSVTSVIILNVNGLNTSTERQRLSNWIKATQLYGTCKNKQKTNLKYEDTG